MSRKSVPPSIDEVAFDCPHCGAYTTQTWHQLWADLLAGERRAPGVPRSDVIEVIQANEEIPEDLKERWSAYYERVARGLVFLDTDNKGKYLSLDVVNLHLSTCFSCGETAIWVHDRLLFPTPVQGPVPNDDLPADVLLDYEEAGRIVALSSRGAAALIRLAIQKLCLALGEKGKVLDDDIASLVKKGLPPLVQQALDSVRVIGNEAVHPGTLDLKDDLDTANRLFELVNIIAERMISNPKHVEEIYAKLPEEKKKAIDKRDGRGR